MPYYKSLPQKGRELKLRHSGPPPSRFYLKKSHSFFYPMDAPKLMPIEWPDETHKLYIFIGEYFNHSQKLEIGAIAVKPFILKDGFMSFTSTGSSGFIYHDVREGVTNISGKRFGNGQFYKIIENDDAGD